MNRGKIDGYPGLNSMQYFWGDLQLFYERPMMPEHKLWRGVLERALNDLTFDGVLGNGYGGMDDLKDAYEFFTQPNNKSFQTVCEILNLSDGQIRLLREFAENTFKANYQPPAFKPWKKLGRKPRGYIDSMG